MGCDHLVITHFGVRLLNLGPEKAAALIEAGSGVPTTAASDGLCLELDKLRLNRAGKVL